MAKSDELIVIYNDNMEVIFIRGFNSFKRFLSL